ncbi:MAG: hypothetical protein ABW168_10150 [Sedimenticola sp.]
MARELVLLPKMTYENMLRNSEARKVDDVESSENEKVQTNDLTDLPNVSDPKNDTSTTTKEVDADNLAQTNEQREQQLPSITAIPAKGQHDSTTNLAYDKQVVKNERYVTRKEKKAYRRGTNGGQTGGKLKNKKYVRKTFGDFIVGKSRGKWIPYKV